MILVQIVILKMIGISSKCELILFVLDIQSYNKSISHSDDALSLLLFDVLVNSI
jgi:hypothetical protein